MESGKAILIFDGVCNFCSSSVRFLLKHDKRKIFQFAWLQSQAGRDLCRQYGVDPEKENSMVLIAEGEVYTRSMASLVICKLLGGAWKPLYFLRVVPRGIRDALYTFFANHRYSWFGKKNVCEMPDEKDKARFLF